MAIVYTEIWSERNQTRSVNEDGSPNWSATRAWDVVDTTKEDEAINAVAEAALDAPHDRNPILKVKTNKADRSGFNSFKVTATYEIPKNGESHSEKGEGGGDPGNSGSPLFTPPNYDFNESEESFATDRDIDGNPIVNSATEAFEGGATQVIKIYTYTITLNQPYYDANQAAEYLNTVNSGVFTTPFGAFQKGEVKFSSVVPVEPFVKTAKFVRCAYSFKILLRAFFVGMPADASPWDARFLDQGTNAFGAKAGGGKELGKIQTKARADVQRDIRLNGKGAPIDADNYFVFTSAGLGAGVDNIIPPGARVETKGAGGIFAVFFWYRLLREKDFGALRLGF